MNKFVYLYSNQIKKETTIIDKDFLNALLSTMQKLYKLSETFGKFKEVMSSEVVVNVPKSLKNIEATLQTVTNTIEIASGYINYFADEETAVK